VSAAPSRVPGLFSFWPLVPSFFYSGGRGPQASSITLLVLSFSPVGFIDPFCVFLMKIASALFLATEKFSELEALLI